MSRESKKRQLRQRMISGEQSYFRQEAQTRDEEIAYRAGGSARRRWPVFFAVLIFLGVVSFGGIQYYSRNYQYVSYETSWEVPAHEGSLVGYEFFGNNILKYTKDGMSYTNNRGKNIWTESYEMKSPIIAVNGEYAAVADQQGNRICICNTEGKTGETVTVLPISKITISGTGIVAAVLEDSAASYITFFRRDGSALDITVKTKMAGDGYPLDLSLSEDGTQLMCSYVYLQSGALFNRVVFYDFSEIGKNVPNRLVGGFDDPFSNTLTPRVAYLASPYSCAFTGNGPVFFSSQNLAVPKLITQVSMVEDSIKSVFYSKDYVGMIVEHIGSEYQNRLEVYRADGTHVLTKEFTYEYADADIEGDMIILHNDRSCLIYNMAGVEKFRAEFDFSISKIRRGRFPNTLIVTGPQLMREIKLK